MDSLYNSGNGPELCTMKVNAPSSRQSTNSPVSEYRVDTLQILQQLYGTTVEGHITGLSVRCGQQRYELFR